jgi:hypothetical protein
MPEICFEAFAWKVSEGNKRLPFPAMVLEEVTLHLGIAAAIAMFVAEATECLRGRVPLLGGCGLVLGDDLVEDRLEGTEFRCEATPRRRDRLGTLEHLPDRDSRQVEFPGDLPDGLAIATCPPNSAVIVHREHFRSLRASECFHAGALTLPKAAGWVTFRRSLCP